MYIDEHTKQCRFWSSIWVNRTHPPAQRTKLAAQRYIRELTAAGSGEVWHKLVAKPEEALRILEGRMNAIIFWSTNKTTRANLESMEQAVLRNIVDRAEQKRSRGGWFFQ
jgi:hypothetical protein